MPWLGSQQDCNHEDRSFTRDFIEEISLFTLTAMSCHCEGWRDIERFGRVKIAFLRRVFPFTHGIPSDDTLHRFFRTLNLAAFRECFVSWVKALHLPENLHVAINGEVNPLHMVSAFLSEYRLVLAQEKVADNSNEIKVIPKLLSLLDLQGALVTIDAMGCRLEIAKKKLVKKELIIFFH